MKTYILAKLRKALLEKLKTHSSAQRLSEEDIIIQFFIYLRANGQLHCKHELKMSENRGINRENKYKQTRY
jgi:hypothetical protein